MTSDGEEDHLRALFVQDEQVGEVTCAKSKFVTGEAYLHVTLTHNCFREHVAVPVTEHPKYSGRPLTLPLVLRLCGTLIESMSRQEQSAHTPCAFIIKGTSETEGSGVARQFQTGPRWPY